jgi:hypothetical protein
MMTALVLIQLVIPTTSVRFCLLNMVFFPYEGTHEEFTSMVVHLTTLFAAHNIDL